jgi:glycosyltransferase involved in cell wall biosynthesis
VQRFQEECVVSDGLSTNEVRGSKRLRLLLIGHLSSAVSGSSLSFRNLAEMLTGDSRVSIQVVSTERPAHLTTSFLANAFVGLRVTAATLRRLRAVQVVSFHASLPAMTAYAPVLFVLTRVFRKPLVLRLFGGAFAGEFSGLSGPRRWLFEWTIRNAELFLVQTRHLVEMARVWGARNARWYPTSRPLAALRQVESEVCGRFVFLGRVIESKGVGVILAAARHWTAGITLDIYGSTNGDYTADRIEQESGGRVHYQGELSFEQVQEILFRYDALVLPTFYEGEGYPGVILEAYSHGLPVIATHWRALAELVDDSCGVLIQPRSPEALAEAMNALYCDHARFERLRLGALAKREQFSDQFWADQFVNWCIELADGH